MKIRMNKKLATLMLTGIILTGCGNTKTIANDNIIEPVEIGTDQNEFDDNAVCVTIYKNANEEEIIGFALKRDAIKAMKVNEEFASIVSGDINSNDYLYGYTKIENLEKYDISYEDNTNVKLNSNEINEMCKTNANVNFRNEPNMDSTILEVLPNNTYITVVNDDGEWSEVYFGDRCGYVKSEFINKEYKLSWTSEPLKHVYFNKDVNIYDDASLENKINEEKIEKYQHGMVYFETDNSYFVIIDNISGYVDKESCNELNDTFIIVDISDQEVSLYRNNKLILISPVVTGKNSTPTDIGCHKIFKVRRNTILQDEKKTYASYVDYMLNFNNGEGLHDAENITHVHEDGKTHTHGWRDASEFGGNTYQYNGSHGCVNMPYEAVQTIYNEVVDVLIENFPNINITNYTVLQPEEQIVKVLVKN